MNIIKSRKHHTVSLLDARQKERGVVLISCIIFLVLILLMLRITMSSSYVAEQKSGIEQDISVAQESAQLALRAAENEIISVVSKSKIKECENSADISTKCITAFKKALVSTWKDAVPPVGEVGYLASTDPVVVDAVEELKKKRKGDTRLGFYTKSDTCGAVASSKPVWECVNWNPDGQKYYNKAQPDLNTKWQAIVAQDISTLSGSKIDVPPRFIIERFLPSEIGLDKKANLLFRITAIGFGQSGGDTNNVTNAIFQANYAL